MEWVYNNVVITADTAGQSERHMDLSGTYRYTTTVGVSAGEDRAMRTSRIACITTCSSKLPPTLCEGIKKTHRGHGKAVTQQTDYNTTVCLSNY